MSIEITTQHLFHHHAGDLEEQPVSSPINPDGIFYSIEEKREVLKFLGYQVSES